MKKCFSLLWSTAVAAAAFACVCMASCGKDDGESSKIEIVVSPTAISLLSTQGSSSTVKIITDGAWTLENAPDWVHMSATSGIGNTDVTLTAMSDNFSDQVRTATMSASTVSNTATFTVSQEPSLAKNCNVTLGDMTVMYNGFAADLTFGSEARGYREAFFTESQIASMTEHDIYDMLMQNTEYNSTADYTFSPAVSANTTIVYCVAAYGNENKPDGSHKYGPMTMVKIKTPSMTYYADMPIVAVSYDSSYWMPETQVQGALGQRCIRYYYAYAEDSVALDSYTYSMLLPDAFLVHFVFKPQIASYPEEYAIAGQTFYFRRSSGASQFFMMTWGVDDTNAYSNELYVFYGTTYSTMSAADARKEKEVVDSSRWNEPRTLPTAKEIQKLRESMHVVGIN